MFTLPPWVQPRTAYIHIPFCAHHCGYCDFAVSVGQDAQIELYLDALELECRQLGEPQAVESAFIGGGTPTYLSAVQLRRLLTTLCHWFVLPAAGEFSIESTPDSLDDEKCEVLAEFGVNRVSIGVQSFQPHLLNALDRQHRSDQIPSALAAVRKVIPALSLDLIFAAPGSTLADWQADLNAALALGPDHLSTYGLTYEKGTPLWKQRHLGEVKSIPEDDELGMYEFGIARLTAEGYEQYEVSNFARPGQRCRHNERYWANHAYFGVGVGAARYIGGERALNVRNTQDYIRRMLAGDSATFQSECLPPGERAIETAAIQLRRIAGIDLMAFRNQTGFGFATLFPDALEHLANVGLLAVSDNAVSLTRRGLCVADGVIEHLLKHAVMPS